MSTDALMNAFTQSTFDQVSDDEKIAVLAEDAQGQSGINFEDHFFEPEVGSTYLLKLLPNPKTPTNPNGQYVTHRQAYKKLPDPQRKGKTFMYVSSGNANTCKAMELFFDLYAKEKEGDAVAQKKREKYLGSSREACVKVQILQSPKQEQIGMVRLFRFHTYGPSTIIADLINEKLNPTKEKIAQGFEREDIFDIFESSCLSIQCTEKSFGDNQKGRDFAGSAWAPKKQGAIAKLEDGKTRQFVATDKANLQSEEIKPFFESFVQQVTNPDYDTFKYFEYRHPSDAILSEDDKKYLEEVWKKVDEIIPVIRDKSLQEIAAYGKADTSRSDKESEKSGTDTNVMAESIPEELAGSVMDQAGKTAEQAGAGTQEVKDEAKENGGASDDVNSVLNA